MDVRRGTLLAFLGITWGVACLVVPPVLANWLAPVQSLPVPGVRVIRAVPAPESAPLRLRPRVLVPSPERPRRVDLYGNEISRPVATYRVDDTGTLYEVHSPQTEVPRLPPPRL
jgi:hypothetical protein